jgi:alpha-glucosidase
LPNAGFSTGKPWLPVAEEHLANAASAQETDQDSPLNFARRLIAWRRQQPQLTRGDIVFFDTPEPVLALQRDLPDHPSVLALFNLGPDPVNFELAQLEGAVPLIGHGLHGTVEGTQVSLPSYGAWFGTKS